MTVVAILFNRCSVLLFCCTIQVLALGNSKTPKDKSNLIVTLLQVKINWSKFIIDRLQQRFHMTFLICLFVTSRNLLFSVFLPRKIITVLRKIVVNFRQVSLKELLPSLSVLKCFGEKVGSLKILYCTWILHKWFLRFPVGLFFHLFTFPLIYRSLHCVKSVQIRIYFWSIFSPTVGKCGPEIASH